MLIITAFFQLLVPRKVGFNTCLSSIPVDSACTYSNKITILMRWVGKLIIMGELFMYFVFLIVCCMPVYSTIILIIGAICCHAHSDF